MLFVPSTRTRGVGLALLVFGSTPLPGAVTVASNLSTPTLIALLVAGKTFSVTASGTATLFVNLNASTGPNFSADGKPTYAFPALTPCWCRTG